ncbi:hypothetical protein SAMN04488087_1973 [Rhodothermus profundi]|uniref:Uncharacterized protein n=2 Tax=Rhodothermus profundi TaxID=633813 RepID=A0A1M6VBA1_9BACT|nr:hypothetical protein SAMN04488087_1973 [Rhodothermus profundi]
MSSIFESKVLLQKKERKTLLIRHAYQKGTTKPSRPQYLIEGMSTASVSCPGKAACKALAALPERRLVLPRPLLFDSKQERASLFISPDTPFDRRVARLAIAQVMRQLFRSGNSYSHRSKQRVNVSKAAQARGCLGLRTARPYSRSASPVR